MRMVADCHPLQSNWNLMKNAVLFFPVAVLVLFSCRNDGVQIDGKVDETIGNIETEIEVSGTATEEQLARLIRLYEIYVDSFPERKEVSANFLMRAADNARQLGRYGKSIALYERVLKEFPGTESAPRAMFRQGYLYEHELNRPDSALLLYDTFRHRFRLHPALRTVEYRIDSLAMAFPEIYETIMDKQSAPAVMSADGPLKKN